MAEKLKSLPPQEKQGDFATFCQIWKKNPDGRGVLISELLFDVDSLQTRIKEEQNFQQNLRNGWMK